MSIPLIHCTDLFHPAADPDDHWDLATVYALAVRGRVDPRAVIFDHCPPSLRRAMIWVGDPAIQAVAQLNHITGFSAAAAVGTSKDLAAPDDPQADAAPSDKAGPNLILRVLEESPQPVAISIVGSSKNVAVAANRAPDLFRRKCRGIYLVAGMGTTDPAKGANADTNVRYDPAAFRAIFRIQCPVYWTPCLESMDGPDWHTRLKVERYGCWWKFRQGDILARLSPRARNYFVYALSLESSLAWFRYLDRETDKEKYEKIANGDRYMWSTAAFFHMAGLGVLPNGTAAPLESCEPQSVFTYRGISVETCEAGIADWKLDPGSRDRFIYETRFLDDYQSAMTKALGQLLAAL